MNTSYIAKSNKIRESLKTFKKYLLASKLFFSMSRGVTRNLPRIFMYHRFTKENVDRWGALKADFLEWQLLQISKGWRVLPLGKYLELSIDDKKAPKNTVILTIDDGYSDFYSVAFPLLKKFDFPATLFVTTDFIDGKIWLWPDRIKYALEQTQKKHLGIKVGGKKVTLNIETPERKVQTWDLLVRYLTRVTEKEKWQYLSLLEERLEVALPDAPPKEYSALTWDQIREMAGWGIEIGSHTLTHPILSRLDKPQLIREIKGSKMRIEEMLGCRVASFCYPNGMQDDINEDVIREAKSAGYRGAVLAWGARYEDAFKLPRLAAPFDETEFLWKLCGMETLAQHWW